PPPPAKPPPPLLALPLLALLCIFALRNSLGGTGLRRYLAPEPTSRPRGARRSARAPVDDAAAHDRGLDLHVLDALGGNAEHVLAQDHEVGELPGNEAALLVLLELGVRRSRGVGRERLGERDLLLGHPARGPLAVERRARDRGVERLHRVERGDVPVGAEREAHARVEERAEGGRRLGALGADAAPGPAAVVDRVVRLDRGDHAERGVAREVARGDVLRVLDAEAAVARAVRLLHAL